DRFFYLARVAGRTAKLAVLGLMIKGVAVAEPAFEFVAVLAAQVVHDHRSTGSGQPAPRPWPRIGGSPILARPLLRQGEGPIMAQAGNLGPRLCRPRRIDLSHHNPGLSPPFGQDLTPGIDDQAMAIG